MESGEVRWKMMFWVVDIPGGELEGRAFSGGINLSTLSITFIVHWNRKTLMLQRTQVLPWGKVELNWSVQFYVGD